MMILYTSPVVSSWSFDPFCFLVDIFSVEKEYPKHEQQRDKYACPGAYGASRSAEYSLRGGILPGNRLNQKKCRKYADHRIQYLFHNLGK